MLSLIISQLFINAIAFLAAAYFIPGFDLSGDVVAFLALIGVFTLINVILKPIIKLVLSPVILITLGLFKLVIDGGILYVVDNYSDNLSISGLNALIYATLLIAVVNFVFGGTRKLFKKN